MLVGLLQLSEIGTGTVRWPVVAGAGALLVVLLAFRARSDVAEEMGLGAPEVALLTLGSIGAPLLNVPLGVIGGAVLAVNLGGAIVPVLLTVRFHRHGRAPAGRLLLVTALVAAATWAIVSVDPEAGVVAPFPQFLIPPAVALVGALVVARGRPTLAGPVAYGAGTLGAIVGADLLALPRLLDVAREAQGGTALILGGGGAFDLIFLAGALPIALAMFLALVGSTRPPTAVADPGASPRRVPDPGRLLDEAHRLQGLTPRERCLSHLARANRSLADDRSVEAVRQAHQAVGALLESGSPRLVDRVRERGPDPVRAWMRELNGARRRAEADPPPWHEAADAVELAKQLSGALWQGAPGRVRLGGGGL